MWLALSLGVIAVIQSIMNGMVASRSSFAWASLMNAIVVLGFTLSYFFIQRGPAYLQSIQWWHWIPGLMGFVFVTFLPMAFQKLGAGQAVVFLVAAQMVTGLLWDRFMSDIPVNAFRLVGTVLTIVGAVMVSLGTHKTG